MNRSRLFLTLSFVVAVGFGFWFGPRIYRDAQASEMPALLALAPADSTVIIYADLASLRSAPLVQKLEAATPSPTLDHDYADFIAATGFDFQHDLDRLVVTIGPAPAKQTLMFAEGRFDRQKIGQYALHSGKAEKHNGRDVYVLPSTTPAKTIYLTFLEGNRLAISDGGDLSVLLGALTAGESAKLDPALQDRLSRVSGAPIFAVAKAPDMSSGTSAAAASNPATPFQLLRWVSLAARPDSDQIILSVEGECDGPEQAQKVASGLEFLRALLSGGLSEPKARGQMSEQAASSFSRLLKAARITSDAGRVRLLLDITPDMIATPLSKSISPVTN